MPEGALDEAIRQRIPLKTQKEKPNGLSVCSVRSVMPERFPTGQYKKGTEDRGPGRGPRTGDPGTRNVLQLSRVMCVMPPAP